MSVDELQAQSEKYLELVTSDPNFQRYFAVDQHIHETAELKGHADAVDGVQWIGERSFASASHDGTVKIWDTNKLEVTYTVDDFSGQKSTATSPSSGAASARRPHPPPKGKPGVYSLAASPNGQYLLAGNSSDSHNCWLIDAIKGSAIWHLDGHKASVYSTAFDLTSKQMISGDKDGMVCVHEVGSKRSLMNLHIHDDVAEAVSFCVGSSTDPNPSDSLICCCSRDGSLCVVDLQCPKSPAHRLLDAHGGHALCTCVLLDKHTVITGGADRIARRFDLRYTGDTSNKNAVVEYFGHTATVRCVSVAPGGNLLATAADDGSVRIWWVDRSKMLKSMRDSVRQEVAEAEKKLENCMKKHAGGEDVDVGQIKEMTRSVSLRKAKTHELDELVEAFALGQNSKAAAALQGHKDRTTGCAWRDKGDGHGFQIVTSSWDQRIKLWDIPQLDFA